MKIKQTKPTQKELSLSITDIKSDDKISMILKFKNSFSKDDKIIEYERKVEIRTFQKRLFIKPDPDLIESANRQGTVWYEVIEHEVKK